MLFVSVQPDAIWECYLPMSAGVAAVAVGLLFLSSALAIGYKVVSTPA